MCTLISRKQHVLEELKQFSEEQAMSSGEETSKDTGVMKAIIWLRKMGRPILADKMERELLHVKRQGRGTSRFRLEPVQPPLCAVQSRSCDS